ncbi:MAG: Uncharacterised protein [Cyanobium sp. ARS6]|nr:MAG: Uncharacterised protein [Cyanobium sp. ARS6]
MQQTEETAAEPEAHGAAGFRLKLQGSIRELQLVERFTQVGVLIRFRWKQPAEHHRLGLGVTGQRFIGRCVQQSDRVTHTGISHGLDRCGQIAHLAGMQLIHLALVGRHHAHFIELVDLLALHQQDLVLAVDPAAHHPEIHNYPPVGVVIGVKNQCFGRFIHRIRRRRHPVHHLLKNLRHPESCLG